MKMHLYTGIQVLTIVILWTIKLSPGVKIISIIYPVAIVLLIPLRLLLGKYVFSHHEIEAVSGCLCMTRTVLIIQGHTRAHTRTHTHAQLDSEEDFPEDHENGEGDEYDQINVPY